MKQITSAIKQNTSAMKQNYNSNEVKYECKKARYNDKICAMKQNTTFQTRLLIYARGCEISV